MYNILEQENVCKILVKISEQNFSLWRARSGWNDALIWIVEGKVNPGMVKNDVNMCVGVKISAREMLGPWAGQDVVPERKIGVPAEIRTTVVQCAAKTLFLLS